jgi:dTDP-glucose 4,6-dehydratase
MARLCNWRARTSFEEGLAKTVAWYRENEAWWKEARARERSGASL